MSIYKPGDVVMGKYRLPPPISGPYKGSTMRFSNAIPVVIQGYNNHGYMVYSPKSKYTYMEPGALEPFEGTEDEKLKLRNDKSKHDKNTSPTKGGARKSRKARKNKKRLTRRR